MSVLLEQMSVSGKCDYCYKIRIWQLNIKHMVVYIFVLGYAWSMIAPRVSGGNLKFALREGKSSDSQPILTLYKLILLLSANYYINNE